MELLNQKQMYQADKMTIETLGIPGETLMENAGQAIVSEIVKNWGISTQIVVLAGTGNNGGDGIVIARRLLNLGYQVQLWLIPPEEKVRDVAKVHLELYHRHQYPVFHYGEELYPAIQQADLIVDALLGIGMSGELRPPYDRIVQEVNQSKAKVVSVDIPSGVNAEQATVSQAVRADITYTVQYPKQSAFLYPAASYYGMLQVVDIGIPPQTTDSLEYRKYTWGEKEYQSTKVERSPNSHKGSNGKGLIIGGSSYMIGAPVLAAQACIASGIGLLSCAFPNHILPIAAQKATEATFLPCREQDGNLVQVEIPGSIQVVAIGMGLGRTEQTCQLVKNVLAQDKPTIIDADALFYLNEMWGIVDNRSSVTVVTPHMGEMAHLCGVTIEEIQENRFMVSRKLAMEHGIYVVLKGPYTIVATPEGNQFVNTSGNAGLAKGGSGDVLSGMIAGLLPRYQNPQEAISNTVYLHGLAADKLVEKGYSLDGISAEKLIEILPFLS